MRRPWALFYCSAEANSVYQINTIKGYLTEMGYDVQGVRLHRL